VSAAAYPSLTLAMGVAGGLMLTVIVISIICATSVLLSRNVDNLVWLTLIVFFAAVTVAAIVTAVAFTHHGAWVDYRGQP
jgi:hypothetical protein